MSTLLSEFWAGFVQPMLQRPKSIQMAALCYKTEASEKKVLLVSSRDTGRWVIPKGWPMAGKSSAETALQEAWEEAGVQAGDVAAQPLGAYTYNKRFESGWSQPVRTLVYPVCVTQLEKPYPESHERTRIWVDPLEAANMVQEPELKQLLVDFAADTQPTVD